MRTEAATKRKIRLRGEEIEEVDSYVYLGQEINTQHELSGELARRKKAGWCRFSGLKELLQQNLAQKHKAFLFNSTVIPSMLYGCET